MSIQNPTLQVVLMYASQPRQVHETWLELPMGSTVLQALVAAAGWLQRFPELAAVGQPNVDTGIGLGIWGKKARLDTVLRHHDRLEFYRPLRVDPKVARRERFSKQGARGTGLFAKRRAGAKPGY